MLQQIISVERLRIDRDNRRAEVMKAAVKAQAASDERQFQFQTRKLGIQEERQRRTFRFVREVVWAILAGLALFVALLLYMIFLGNDEQQSVAGSLVMNLVVFVAGYGVIASILRFLNSLMGRR